MSMLAMVKLFTVTVTASEANLGEKVGMHAMKLLGSPLAALMLIAAPARSQVWRSRHAGATR